MGRVQAIHGLRIFDELEAQRSAIEADFGGPLVWERMETRKKCAIGLTLPESGYRDEDAWPQLQDAMIDAMSRLERAFRTRIQNLRP